MSDPSPTAPARRSRAGSLLLVLLVLLALGAGGWYAWTQWQARQDRLLALAEQQRSALDARVEALRQGQRAQAQRLQLADPDPHGAQALRLDQIELLLAIGQQRLRLDDDLEGARRALALAAPLLGGLDDPAYLNLRQALAQEQAAMESLGADPRIRADTLLDQLAAGLDIGTAPASAASANAPWYERLLARVVRVQPTASAGLREAADREAALAALQVEITLARAAIERRDPGELRRSLVRIDGWLRRLLAGSPRLAEKRRLLVQLQTQPLRADSPLAGTTLQQLRALRGK